MSIYLRVVDYDARFRGLSTPPIVANDVDTTTLAGKAYINNLLITKYEGDSLQVLDSCECRYLEGGFENGNVCPKCHTVCTSPVERQLESVLWLRCPNGVRGFMNLTVYNVLRFALLKLKYDVMAWLCDPYHKTNAKLPPVIARLEAAGIQRGINYLHDNFDRIMDICFDPAQKKEWDQRVYAYRTFIAMYRDRIWCQYLPMPSKLVFVVEQNETGTYADRSMALAIDALHTVASVDHTVRQLPLKKKESRIAKGIASLAAFHVQFASQQLARKEGLARKHIYGGRVPFSARAVITSISGVHNYAQMAYPWSLALEILKVHVTNKLLAGSPTRAPLSPAAIDRVFIKYATKYSPVVDDIFKELVAESYSPLGIMALLQRNPTLERGSAQLFGVPKIKTDIEDNTIGMSVLALKAPNLIVHM